MHATPPPASRRALRRLAVGLAAAALTAPALAIPAAADGDLTPILTGEDAGLSPADGSDLPAAEDILPGRYIVQVQAPNRARGGSAASVKDSQDRTVRAAKGRGLNVAPKIRYTQAFNGYSTELSAADAAAMRSVPGVAAVYPVLEVAAPEPVDGAEPQDVYGNAMTGADIAQTELGLSGEGVLVGVIDSGVDYNNPDLGGSGTNDERADFPSDRVVGGYDFVGDNYDADGGGEAAIPKPDAFPDDCGGHGTHVAGIIGADGEVRGVAPEVDIASYRIFGCEGTSSSDVILAAMDRAAADGVDVINMSLGVPLYPWADYPTAQLADQLVADGVTLVVSAGNEGAAGTFSGGSPAAAKDVITVGSVDSTHRRTEYLTDSSGTRIAMGLATPAPAPEAGTRLDLIAAGEPGTDAAAVCDPAAVTPGSADQALLIERGTCSFHQKALAAQEAGYGAAVLYNNSPGTVSPSVAGDPAITIPVVMLSQADGRALAADALSGGESIVFGEGTIVVDNETGGMMSDFSSYGLTADLRLKPDVSAPGGSIWSTLPLESGGHGSMSGTSMAAPHVAGMSALLLEDQPEQTPAQVKQRLMNTADPMRWSLQPDSGLLEPVHRQGAGLVDAVEAIQSPLRISEPSISLGEGELGPRTVELTVTNTGDEDAVYDVGVTWGVATGGSSLSPDFYQIEETADPSTDSIAVAAGATETLTVTFDENIGEDGVIYGGWVTLTDADEDYTVPFAGLSGDYQALQTLTDAGMELPALGTVDENGALVLAEDGHAYDIAAGDVPLVVYHLEYPAQLMEVRAYRLNGAGKRTPVAPSVGHITEEGPLGKDDSSAVWVWDGTAPLPNDKAKPVPSGEYVLEMRVLKAGGDVENPEHWETWESPAFTVTGTKGGSGR